MEPTTFISAVAAKKILTKAVEDLYKLLKDKGVLTYKKIQFDVRATKLYNHLHKIQMVKTLWQVDKAVDIKSFYCDLHVKIGLQRVKVVGITSFGENRSVVIQGIAGQGKSILLRYLCMQCIKEGEVIPVFVELRKVQPDEKLIDYIKKSLAVFDLNVEDAVVYDALYTGKIILFLDGFDEVSESQRKTIISEVEFLSSTIDLLRIFITSRPGTGIEMLIDFNVVYLDYFIGDEYKEVIRKLSSSDFLAKALIKKVEDNLKQLHGLLSTPLMVTLLLMSYKSFQELPTELSDFYDSIFQALLQRHDGTKPGYERLRRCKLNDMQYRLLFEVLCFESLKHISNSYNHDDLYNITQNAINYLDYKEDPENFIKDIVLVTCLILKEGNDYKFIHKSVQEFYTAFFIKRKAEPIAKDFYEKLFGFIPIQLSETVRYLSEIDKYRYNKYYLLPHCLGILNIIKEHVETFVPNPSDKELLRIFSTVELNLSNRDGKNFSLVSIGYEHFLHTFSTFNKFKKLDYSELIMSISENKIQLVQHKPEKKSQDIINYAVRVSELIQKNVMKKQLGSIYLEILNESLVNAKKALDIIRTEESQTISLNF